MSLQYQNFYETTLSAAITNTDTYIPLVTPPTVTESYLLIDWDVPSKREFIYFTSKDSTGVNVLLANRGKDGTTAIAHTKNAKVRMNLNAAMITDIINNVKQMPVGSIHISTVATNPSDPAQLGYGTWVAWGTGRVPVGFDSTQTEFNASEKTGGEKAHTLTTSEMPAHSHTGSTDTQGNHTHGNSQDVVVTSGAGNSRAANSGSGQQFAWSTGNVTGAAGAHSHSFTTNNAGSGAAHNVLQPFITVYMWKRTA